MFSKACEYGIRASIHIAHQAQLGKRISLKDIAKAIDSPIAFTAKILQALAKNGIIESIKGPQGGYTIKTESCQDITLAAIVESIDGNSIYQKCGLGLKSCNEEKPCPVHHKFKKVRDELETMLKTTSIQDLTLELHDGLTFLKQ